MALALVPCACTLLLDGEALTSGGALDPPPPDAATTAEAGDGGAADDADAGAARGLRFRATSKLTTSARAGSFVLDKPVGTQPGDLLWVVVSEFWDYAITPPAGFIQVASDYNDACGPPSNGGWSLYTYSHIATADEPATYVFAIGGQSEGLSALVLALEGVAPNGAAPVSDGTRRIAANPFVPPAVATPPEDTYALAVFTQRGGGVWATPSDATPFAASSAMSVFGRIAPATQPLDFGASTSTPDGCGQAHVALFRMK